MLPHRDNMTYVWLLCLLWTLPGCAERIAARVSLDYEQHKPRGIAVAPVRNDTGKPLTAPPSRAYVKALLERAFFKHDASANDIAMTWRRQIAYELSQKAYDVLPLDAVDASVGAQQTSGKPALSTDKVKQQLGVDALLYSAITAWDTRKLKTDNAITVAASFTLVEVGTNKILWEATWPHGSVSIRATQPWRDIRYYIARVVDAAFATLP